VWLVFSGYNVYGSRGCGIVSGIVAPHIVIS